MKKKNPIKDTFPLAFIQSVDDPRFRQTISALEKPVHLIDFDTDSHPVYVKAFRLSQRQQRPMDDMMTQTPQDESYSPP